MSNVNLTGTGTAIPPITTSLISLRITGNPALTEVDVAKLKTSGPITGRYDSVAKTANVKILPADFNTLTADVTGGGQVSIEYTCNDSDGAAVAFTFTPLKVVVAMADAPPSGITANETDVSEAVG